MSVLALEHIEGTIIYVEWPSEKLPFFRLPVQPKMNLHVLEEEPNATLRVRAITYERSNELLPYGNGTARVYKMVWDVRH